VDDAVADGSGRVQAAGVGKRGQRDAGAQRGEPVGGCGRAGQSCHLMAGVPQFGDHGRADEARGSRDEYAHDSYLQGG
jgi:hypothetical protein